MVTRPRASNFTASPSKGGSSNFVGVSYQGADRLIEKVTQVGFSCMHLPVLTTLRLPLTQPLSEAIVRLRDGYFTWLVLLSPTAVCACRDAWMEVCGDVAFPNATKVALQGPGTAEAFTQAFLRAPDLLPELFLAEELARSLSQTITESCSPSSANVLLMQARDGRNVVAPIVAATGANVECHSLYATEEVPLPQEVRSALVEMPEHDMILLFMSPSAVRATTHYLEERHKKKSQVLCVGPITAHAARECGYENIIESKDHSEDGIVALLRFTFRAA